MQIHMLIELVNVFSSRVKKKTAELMLQLLDNSKQPHPVSGALFAVSVPVEMKLVRSVPADAKQSGIFSARLSEQLEGMANKDLSKDPRLCSILVGYFSLYPERLVKFSIKNQELLFPLLTFPWVPHFIPERISESESKTERNNRIYSEYDSLNAAVHHLRWRDTDIESVMKSCEELPRAKNYKTFSRISNEAQHKFISGLLAAGDLKLPFNLHSWGIFFVLAHFYEFLLPEEQALLMQRVLTNLRTIGELPHAKLLKVKCLEAFGRIVKLVILIDVQQHVIKEMESLFLHLSSLGYGLYMDIPQEYHGHGDISGELSLVVHAAIGKHADLFPRLIQQVINYCIEKQRFKEMALLVSVIKKIAKIDALKIEIERAAQQILMQPYLIGNCISALENAFPFVSRAMQVKIFNEIGVFISQRDNHCFLISSYLALSNIVPYMSSEMLNSMVAFVSSLLANKWGMSDQRYSMSHLFASVLQHAISPSQQETLFRAIMARVAVDYPYEPFGDCAEFFVMIMGVLNSEKREQVINAILDKSKTMRKDQTDAFFYKILFAYEWVTEAVNPRVRDLLVQRNNHEINSLLTWPDDLASAGRCLPTEKIPAFLNKVFDSPALVEQAGKLHHIGYVVIRLPFYDQIAFLRRLKADARCFNCYDYVKSRIEENNSLATPEAAKEYLQYQADVMRELQQNTQAPPEVNLISLTYMR